MTTKEENERMLDVIEENEDKFFYVNKVSKYNCDGLCSEEFCDKAYTHYVTIKRFGKSFYLTLCREHAKLWEEKLAEEGGWEWLTGQQS